MIYNIRYKMLPKEIIHIILTYTYTYYESCWYISTDDIVTTTEDYEKFLRKICEEVD